ncbi:MAG: hypothetical protein AB7E79_16410 [Rhodospirillaceae bacterium]
MDIAAYYVERAQAVRSLAGAMSGSDNRRTLLMLADQWEALAVQRGQLKKTQDACDRAAAEDETRGLALAPVRDEMPRS